MPNSTVLILQGKYGGTPLVPVLKTVQLTRVDRTSGRKGNNAGAHSKGIFTSCIFPVGGIALGGKCRGYGRPRCGCRQPPVKCIPAVPAPSGQAPVVGLQVHCFVLFRCCTETPPKNGWGCGKNRSLNHCSSLPPVPARFPIPTRFPARNSGVQSSYSPE